MLDDGVVKTRLEPGDIAYGPTGVAASLRFLTPFRQLFISAPRVALDHRLIAPPVAEDRPAEGRKGRQRPVRRPAPRHRGPPLDDLSGEDLRPVELALTEFLVSGLAAAGEPASQGGAEGARVARLHRICQIIETRLPDPGLTLAKIAEEGRRLAALSAKTLHRRRAELHAVRQGAPAGALQGRSRHATLRLPLHLGDLLSLGLQ